jgi:hypothetical protein
MHGHSRKKNIFMYGCENKRARNLVLYDRDGYNHGMVLQGRGSFRTITRPTLHLLLIRCASV